MPLARCFRFSAALISLLRFASGGFALLGFACAAQAGEWRPLLDQDLSQWETYLSYRHVDGYDGRPPVDAAGKTVAPIGFGRDETGVFTVVEKDGVQALRVSGEIYGCLISKRDYANYRLKLKVKWGEKKWDPRRGKLRDSGILYHSVGEPGVEYWRSWMLSQEFQIMEGHMGDYWCQANSAIDIRAFLPEGMMNSVAGERQPFRPFGPAPGIASFCLRSADYESPPGAWTELELICFEGRSLHLVNGHVVMILRDSRVMTDAGAKPLAHGKLQLQSEAAEVFFADIRIQEIDALPAEYARLFE